MSNNDITGDRLVSRSITKAFEENFDRIFGKKKTKEALECTCAACVSKSCHPELGGPSNCGVCCGRNCSGE